MTSVVPDQKPPQTASGPQPSIAADPQKPVVFTPGKPAEVAEAKTGIDAKALDRDIHTAVSNIGPTPGIEVTEAPDGLLVTLMDERKFGMFAVGSAEPEPRTHPDHRRHRPTDRQASRQDRRARPHRRTTVPQQGL